ncbi:anti-sigma factor family protein [Hyalangium rubrum]|uniref:Zf-HC2 domain-containing protein n=1 Tax=Hyalangium rubrum TaxID=3103134 RepID=A0ABU5H2T7_9BACT|nr:zf-HC2 domain-containing protein [Hyalangium sp. s54d21]MDY7227780.1 zf-HC2 domain-containing protein [Hyalangium sp. s54d21]
MAGNPACERFVPLLSPYIDGELTPTERVNVERHLTACKACTGRTADLRAESGLMRVGLEMAVDEVDFKDFAQKVMARVTPERPPLLERLKLSLSEMFLYQRTAMLSSLATAAVLMLVAVPLLLRDNAPVGYGAERMTVKSVRSYEPAKVAPVVMETENGGAIIWLVDQNEAARDEAQSDELEMDSPALKNPVRPQNPGLQEPPAQKGGAL